MKEFMVFVICIIVTKQEIMNVNYQTLNISFLKKHISKEGSGRTGSLDVASSMLFGDISF